MRKQPIPFGKYSLLDRINIGGMAEVWRAKAIGEHGFEKPLAIKRILPSIAEDQEFITMFIDEAKITVKLTHANVGQVFDLGKINDSYFIAMEYVAGKDLNAIFERCRKSNEPVSIPMVCYIVSKMCEGLDYAHRKRDENGHDLDIVHRDVSPHNCLVSFEGEVKVIDFGIAKATSKVNRTQTGVLKGKLGYMSPEQVIGHELDRRSDVFSAGVVLYELLTCEKLFVGESEFSILEKVRRANVQPPTKLNPDIPETLEKIVLKALAKNPDSRYQWASDFGDALQHYLISSGSLFSRKDMAQYMRATFAEEIEVERRRQAEFQGAGADESSAPVSSEPADNADRTLMLDRDAGGFAIQSDGQSPQNAKNEKADARRETRDPREQSVAQPLSKSIEAPSDRPYRRRKMPPYSLLALALAAAGLVLLIALAAFLLVPGTGALSLEYEPAGAKLLVDGAEVCSSSPCPATSIKAGVRKLELRKEGFEPHSQRIQIVRNSFVTLPLIKLKSLAVSVPVVIAADPIDAEISINDRIVKKNGARSIYSAEWKAGEPHRVTVSKPGCLPWRKTFIPIAGDKVIVELAKLSFCN